MFFLLNKIEGISIEIILLGLNISSSKSKLITLLK